jgi:mRNA interferase RelE/StbE
VKAFTVQTTPRFDRQLAKLGKNAQRQIVGFLEEQLDGCANPRVFGKPLKGDMRGQWRYRTGDYRIICLIQDAKLVVLAVGVGDRKDVYR